MVDIKATAALNHGVDNTRQRGGPLDSQDFAKTHQTHRKVCPHKIPKAHVDYTTHPHGHTRVILGHPPRNG